jgi:hypothetical protein
VLYISDFDPAGLNMPVAAARKIEFLARNSDVEFDVQVRPVVLTLEQCEEFDLPRTPIKASEKRRDTFEDRFGRGATELDALEALHAGALRQIVEGEIGRYIDPTLSARLAEKYRDVQGQVNAVNEQVRAGHDAALDSIQERHAELAQAYNAGIAELNDELAAVHEAMRAELAARQAEFGSAEWPEAVEGDEDPDPMFDSTRDYQDQVQRYKAHKDELGPGDAEINLVKALDIRPTNIQGPVRRL